MYQIPVWFFMSYVAVRYSRARLELTRQMVAFDVVEAACKEDSDRTMILEAIEDRFGSTEAFNCFLRICVRKGCAELFNSVPSYTTILFVTSSTVLCCLDIPPEGFEGPTTVRIAWGIAEAVTVFCVVPLDCAFLFTCADSLVHRKTDSRDVVLALYTCCAGLLELVFVWAATFILPMFLLPKYGMLPLALIAPATVGLSLYTFTRARVESPES
eukprot:TRINITY_DN12702_c0_g1_i3.p1 TRINITY_DN12702_c0_g1~~TRINITY_DN12702_c0_g1_i3.p1  ORF type:complete len:237 (-),score=14.03 TRINITY_DN12702_c0_g1_i3:121-762(-)